MALVGVAMVAMIAMAGLSIDVGTLYEASAEAQRAADAGALAAARTISMQGLTGDPTDNGGTGGWSNVCGGSASLASLAATTVVTANPISGTSTTPTVTVTYSYFGGSPVQDCSGMVNSAFGVNPLVTVLVQQTNLPTYFSRIWGRTGNTVSATATAEVFNSANSNFYASGGEVVPVQPRCVKPWMVPNSDPGGNGGTCSPTTTACPYFITPTTSTLANPGVSEEGAGVIGERFWLMADCSGTGTCALISAPPQANYSFPYTPNLEYVPGQVPAFSSALTAIPSCASGATTYTQAIAGCDQSTPYRCGVQQGNTADLSQSPVSDTSPGVQCVTHQGTTSLTNLSGQDALLPSGTLTGGAPPNYPFQIQAGSSNPLTAVQGSIITSSNSIMSLPIYDTTIQPVFTPGGTTPVTIVGFLQVFVNVVDGLGNMYVTVLNVSGCGNGTTPVGSTPMYGSSPVPVRLITSP